MTLLQSICILILQYNYFTSALEDCQCLGYSPPHIGCFPKNQDEKAETFPVFPSCDVNPSTPIKVVMHNYNFQSIPEKAFDYDFNITEIIITNVPELKEVDENAFKGKNQENIVFIDLSAGNITSIPVEALQNLSNLEGLALKHQPLEPNVLSDLNKLPSSLHSVDLDGTTSITKIPTDAFMGMENLKEIKFKNMKSLTTIEAYAFRGVGSKMTKIDLSSNSINEIGSGFCVGLQNVKRIDLSHNRIPNLSFLNNCSMESLEELYIVNPFEYSNGYTLYEGIFSHMPELKYVTIHYVKVIESHAFPYKLLESINIAFSADAAVHKSAFSEHSIRALTFIIRGNITVDPAAYTAVQKLHIQLEQLPERISNVTSDNICINLGLDSDKKTSDALISAMILDARFLADDKVIHLDANQLDITTFHEINNNYQLCDQSIGSLNQVENMILSDYGDGLIPKSLSELEKLKVFIKEYTMQYDLQSKKISRVICNCNNEIDPASFKCLGGDGSLKEYFEVNATQCNATSWPEIKIPIYEKCRRLPCKTPPEGTIKFPKKHRSPSKKGGIGTGGILAIVFGVIIFIVLVIVIGFLMMKSKDKKNKVSDVAQEEEDGNADNPEEPQSHEEIDEVTEPEAAPSNGDGEGDGNEVPGEADKPEDVGEAKEKNEPAQADPAEAQQAAGEDVVESMKAEIEEGPAGDGPPANPYEGTEFEIPPPPQ